MKKGKKAIDCNVTPRGVRVAPGQVWKDCDSRMQGRLVKVLSVSEGKAEVRRCDWNGQVLSARITILSVRRMYEHSTGFRLVEHFS